MVEQGAVERFGGGGKATRDPAIGIAGPRIAARMIVREYDSGAAKVGCVGDDVADWENGAGLVAAMTGDVKAACLLVHMSDPKCLAARILFRKAAGEESLCGCEAIEL